jgi:hypothetical protein
MSFPNLPGHPDLAGLPNSLGPVEPAEREVRSTGGLGGAEIPKMHRAAQIENSGEAKHYARSPPIASTRRWARATNLF